ncbi:MAG: hypothetical protein DMG90_05220 [Acidobacteria bacterium]|jgi:membrane protein required for colicin V production|nr:MAG: hypothetical protein DMG90_05220 [Acidobacteriota bacterium]
MNAADWIIVVVILMSTVQAAASGFFQEAFGIAGLFFGYVIAAWQYHRLGLWLGNYLKSPELADSAGFLAIFLLVMMLAGIAGRVARWSIKKTGLSFLDRLLGGVLGFARGCLMVAIVLMSITSFTPAARWLTGSELAPYFLVVGRAAIWVAPSELRARFYQGLDFLHRSGQAAGGR